MEDILVSISCITYNHAQYIRQCLDGLLMQKTNFAYEILIHDDCSTDGTADIIRDYALKYPKLIKPIYETINQYSQGKPIGTKVWNLPRAKGKYMAMCEGDDYWVDENKLQKQVDYMESHPDCTICYTSFNLLYDESDRIIKDCFKTLPRRYKQYNNIGEFILNTPYMCPPSWLFSVTLYRELQETPNSPDTSFELFTYLMTKGNVHFLDQVTCVYRVLRNSASHSGNSNKMLSRRENLLKLQIKMIEQYGLDDNYIDKARLYYYKNNLLFFAENNYVNILNTAEEIINEKSCKEMFLLFVGKNKVLSRILHRIHLLRSIILGY